MPLETRMTHEENLIAQKALLDRIKENLPALKKLFDAVDNDSHCATEELFYRYYHNSLKTYGYQNTTLKMVEMLKTLSPQPLNEKFLEIIGNGTGKVFRWNDGVNLGSNALWDEENLPMIQAFCHAKFFLQMAVRYGETLTEAQTWLPTGYAALLYLYNLR